MSTMGERIREARIRKEIYQSKLAELVGVKSAAVISNWEKDINKPDADKIVKLCEVLGVSASYLLDYSGNGDFSAEPHEIEYIKKYRFLDDYGKEAVDWILNHEHTRCLNAASVAKEDIVRYNVIPLRRSEQPASAGRGIYLGPEAFETIMVVENDLTKRALFCVPVSGDSMEPLYHNGDTLIIERNECMSIGSIGVFTLNGEGFVKELGRGELISLNPEYDPIPYDESLIQNGEVIGVLDPEWIVG